VVSVASARLDRLGDRVGPRLRLRRDVHDAWRRADTQRRVAGKFAGRQRHGRSLHSNLRGPYGPARAQQERDHLFEANQDSAGQPLDGKCSYRIDGSNPDARWWSITVYGTDHYLLPNSSKRYSVTKTNVVRSADGSFSVRLSTTPEEGNWIATSENGFELTLRLYNPGTSVRERPDAVTLPSVTKEACS